MTERVQPEPVTTVLAKTQSSLLAGGVDAAAIDEVTALLARNPNDVSIAVVGPHNAGKTTLIAILTGSAEAKAGISSDVETTKAAPYRYRVGESSFTMWDTPGLGTEHLDHDELARDQITRADAVLVAMSTGLVSQRMRDQLAELLKVGRKKGAVVPVVTKADRAPLENRPNIEADLTAALPEMGSAFRFMSNADEVLESGESQHDSGIEELEQAVVDLALGEARHRIHATGAIRLLVLIDDAESGLAVQEPESAAALQLQRRMHKLLTRTDRRLLEALAAAGRKERLAAYRAVSVIAEALDAGTTREAIDLAWHEAWDSFVTESRVRADELSVALADRLTEAALELDRLEQGPLAEALRSLSADLGVDGVEIPDSIDTPNAEAARQVLEGVRLAAKLVKGAKYTSKGGRSFPAAPLVDALGEVIDFALDSVQEKKIREAKERVRSIYDEKAEEFSDSWIEQVDELRDETTRSALLTNATIEQELFEQLTHVRDDVRSLAEARTHLNEFVSTAIASGHAPES